MKILVTGANGFVGTALCSRLEACKAKVVPVVRCASMLPNEVVAGNLSETIQWLPILSGCGVVVHLAARVHVMHDKGTDPLTEFRLTNVEGTLTLARQAATSGIRRFVFVSTVKVNGEGRTIPYRETDEPAPEDAYAISKFEAEQGLMSIAHETGMEVVIIRPPLIYGPGVKGNFAKLVCWVRKGIPLPLGALHNKRSLLALDNLVNFIELCADEQRSPKAANEIFLLSDGEDISTSELLHKVALAYGTKTHLIPVPPSLMKLGAKLLGKSAVADRLLGSLMLDSSKAKELLGWEPVITINEQLRKMADHVASI